MSNNAAASALSKDKYDDDRPRKFRRVSKNDLKTPREILLSGIAGGIAGCVAKTSVAPLDRIKILFQAGEPEYRKYAGSFTGAFQASAQIYRETGLRGLLQGHSITLLRIFPYAAIKFMAYDAFHHVLMPTEADETSLRLGTAGALAGITSVFFTYPLELIRVRLAFEIRHSMNERTSVFSTARKIYTEGKPPSTTSLNVTSAPPTSQALFHKIPILKFYRGYLVSIMGMIPYAGTSFLVWGNLQNRMRNTLLFSPKQRRKYRTLLDLGCGAIAGAMSQTASYPFEVIRRRMQVGGLTSPDQYVKLGDTVKTIWAKSGYRGFFVGLSIGYLKVVPMTALSFTTWRACKRLFGLESQKQQDETAA